RDPRPRHAAIARSARGQGGNRLRHRPAALYAHLRAPYQGLNEGGGKAEMGRKRAFPWRWRIAAALLLIALIGGAWLWWQARHWAPPRDEYSVQGALVGAHYGPANFGALRAIGADFV